MLPRLPLPGRIKALIGNLFAQTIRVKLQICSLDFNNLNIFQCCVPDLKSLREFVSRPPICSTRLHCTMIRHDEDANQSSGTCYTLYLEFLGGLVPLLKGKRTSKIRPEFVIFDPQIDGTIDGGVRSRKGLVLTMYLFSRSLFILYIFVRFYHYHNQEFIGVQPLDYRNQRSI